VTLEVSVTVGGGITTVRVKVIHTIPFVDSLRQTVFICFCVGWFCFAEYLHGLAWKECWSLGTVSFDFMFLSQRVSLLKTGLLMSHEGINA